MKNSFILILIFLLSNCSSTPNIAGSNYIWPNYKSTFRSIEVNNLKINQVIVKDLKCNNKERHIIELNGIINYDTSLIVEKILSEINSKYRCFYKSTPIVTEVTLNSKGGLLADGYRMGEIFKKYGVHATITNNQVCMSSCSMAFIGAKFRRMNGNAKLMVHSPYRRTGYRTIECIKNDQANKLKKYYISMLGENTGSTLYDRTMKYCTASDGWTINKDAADLFGITTNQ
jgi:ATP-dependent protease ClpP protease subunit